MDWLYVSMPIRESRYSAGLIILGIGVGVTGVFRHGGGLDGTRV